MRNAMLRTFSIKWSIMARAGQSVTFLPRLILAFSVLFVGLTTMRPVPVQAQSMIEALFGRPTLEHRRKIGRSSPRQFAPQRTVKRKSIRKTRSATRTYRNKSTRSTSSGTRSRSASKGSSYTYRTLCVRKADGYFFPVSFSTTSDYFDQDLEACEARCPGTDVDLYFHRVLREEAENMVSHTTGEDYTDLVTAFAYKETGIDKAAAKACEIKPQPALGMQIAEGLGDLPFASPIPLPVWRPGQEEEVLVSELRGRSNEVAEVSNREKVIRRVGPKFFPDQ